MIHGYMNDNGRLRSIDHPLERFEVVTWADLHHPSTEEEASLEAKLGVDIPTREEMEEIEISSRLYHEDGAVFMTATLPAHTETDEPEMAPVTFVLVGEQLITVRYHEPRAFHTFPIRAQKTPMGFTGGESVLIALLEAIVDRLADILERAGGDIDRTSRLIFRPRDAPALEKGGFQSILHAIGRKGDLTSNVRHSLVTLDRVIAFLSHVTAQRKSDKEIRTRLKTLARDTHSLTDHAGFLSQKITFLLDATLGMLNIEQNAIIKIFSVAAVVFLPPTLIASIYGMNFEHMPELEWLLGYPFALLLMVGSAILPFWYFKHRGWL